MISNPSRRMAFVLCLLLVVTAMVPAQTANGTYVTDTSRRIIHLDSYEPTPGDVYTLSINYGFNFESRTAAATEYVQLILSADYTLSVPFIGSVNVRTLSYEELQEEITTRVKDRSYAQFVTLNLTAPAVFDVLVWGGVANPGFQSMTSLTRLDAALGVAGGSTNVGSKRQIEVIRNGQTATYDLTSYARQGDAAQNPFIKPGDEIRVPLVESSARLVGAVAQPGPVEVLPGETVGDLIELAGGLLPTARIERATIRRIGDENRYGILSVDDVDITTMSARAGDVVTIPSSITTTELIQVEGAIYTTPSQEGSPRSIPMQPILLDVPYRPGLTVLGLLEEFGGPTPFADTERSFIIRAGSGERSLIPDLGEVWDSRQWERDIPLNPGDRLVIPMMRLAVSVAGQVNSPGSFAFTSGYAVSDYIALAGGITELVGSRNRLFFAQDDGSLSRVDRETPVPVGTSIIVGRSAWGETRQFFGNVIVVTGWVAGIAAAVTAVVELIQLF